MASYKLVSDIFKSFTSLSIKHINQDGEETTNSSPSILNDAEFTVDGNGFSIPWALLQSITIDAVTFTGVYNLQTTNTLVADFELWASSNSLGGASIEYSITNNVLTFKVTGLPLTSSDVSIDINVDVITRTYNATLTPYFLYSNLSTGLHTFKIADISATSRFETKCVFIEGDICNVPKEYLVDYYLLMNAENCNCKCSNLRVIWECLQAALNNDCDEC